MKLIISFPATGCQKLIDVDNEHKLHMVYEKLWVKSRRIMWSIPVVGMTNKIFP